MKSVRRLGHFCSEMRLRGTDLIGGALVVENDVFNN